MGLDLSDRCAVGRHLPLHVENINANKALQALSSLKEKKAKAYHRVAWIGRGLEDVDLIFA